MIRVVLVLISTLLFAMPVRAQIVITKVVYDPPGANTGHQWIEVQNIGPEPIDLGAKDIRLFDTTGNHLIKGYGGSNTVLAGGASVVIAQNPLLFLTDTPDFPGTLIKSSFSLPASKGEVGITKTDGTILGKVAYVAPPVVKAPSTTKLSSTKSSTNKRAHSSTITSSTTAKSSLKNNNSSYGKGTVARTGTADAAPVRALVWPSVPLLSSVWFVAFLALLAFSSFSLILIERDTRHFQHS